MFGKLVNEQILIHLHNLEVITKMATEGILRKILQDQSTP